MSHGLPTAAASPSPPSVKTTTSSRSIFSILRRAARRAGSPTFQPAQAARKWRPDGKAILFESRVYPNALDDEANKKIAAEHKERKYNVRVYEHFPVRYWNQWLDERQPTIMVQSIEPGAAAKDILSATALARTAGFSGTETETSVTLAPLWSPDGREVVFTATTERWNAAFAHVRLSPVSHGRGRAVSPASSVPLQATTRRRCFSPDGKALYFKYAAAGFGGLSSGAALQSGVARGRRADAGDPRLRSRNGALCADAGRQVRHICWYRTPARKISIELPPTAANRCWCSSPPPAATPRSRFQQKAAKPVLIAELRQFGQSGGNRAHRSRSTAARQSHARRYRRRRGDRLAAAAAFLFHQRQGPQHPQHDRAAAGIRSPPRNIRCWC